MFEKSSSSSGGLVELAQQPSSGEGATNLFNLETTTQCRQAKTKICADQPETGYQTRPGQAAWQGTEMRCDRLGQARTEQLDQPGDL